MKLFGVGSKFRVRWLAANAWLISHEERSTLALIACLRPCPAPLLPTPLAPSHRFNKPFSILRDILLCHTPNPDRRILVVDLVLDNVRRLPQMLDFKLKLPDAVHKLYG